MEPRLKKKTAYVWPTVPRYYINRPIPFLDLIAKEKVILVCCFIICVCHFANVFEKNKQVLNSS